MPKVKIQKNFSIQAEQLFSAVKEVLSKDKELKALEANLEICGENITSDSLTAQVKGSKITGQFCVIPDGDKSSIDIDIKLPLMLAPFKGLVQKKIEEKLAKLT